MQNIFMPNIVLTQIYKKVFICIAVLLFLPNLSAFELTQIQTKSIEQFVNSALDESKVPGVSIAIVKDGKTVFNQGFGVTKLNQLKSVDENTLFAIASNSKAFTAAAIGILVERKKLNWDDKVITHLPYFKLYDDYASDNMTIIDLLSHRLGYKAFSGDLLWYDTNYTPEEIIRRFQYVKPDNEFRNNFGYSNMGYIAAGEIISQVSGMSWDEFIKKEIFKPLKMKHSATHKKQIKNTKLLASPHFEKLNINNEVVFESLDWHQNDAINAAGSIITSSSDITNWLKLQLNRGVFEKNKIFDESISQKMWTAHNAIPKPPRKKAEATHLMSYGLGWFLRDFHGKLMVNHSGSVEGMTSQITLIPEENLAIAVFTNSTAPLASPITQKILSTYLNYDYSFDAKAYFEKRRNNVKQTIIDRKQSLGDVVNDTSASHPQSDYIGTYRSKMYGDVVVLERNKQLSIQFLPSPMLTGKLTHRHYDVFNLIWDAPRAWINEGTAHFVSNAKGKIVELRLNVPNDDIWFDEPSFIKQ